MADSALAPSDLAPGNYTGNYSDRVLRHFDAPEHAGSLDAASDTGNRQLAGRAESKARAAWVEFSLAVAADSVSAAVFQARGCPHLIAAADIVAARLEGQDIQALAGFDAGFLETELPLPPEKLDIRILLEDAVRDAAKGAGTGTGMALETR